MANEFKYTVSAEDRSKSATQSASKNMEGMETSAKKLGNTLKAAFSIAAIVAIGRQVAKLGGDMITAYQRQEQAERRLAAAAAGNPLINADGVQNLIDFSSELQKLTMIGDEATIEILSMATAWGRTESEAKSLMTASADLAATFGIDVVTAARGVNMAMEGNVEMLGRYVPELRGLTEEQLSSGEAMRILNERFGGMAEAMAQGVEGAKVQFQNAMGDMMEAVGSILGPLQARTLQALQPMVEKATQWINDHAEQILNFFINFPDIVRLSMASALQFIQRLFTADTLRVIIGAVWEYFKAQMTAVLTWAWEYMKAWGQFIFEPLKTGIEWAGYGIKVAWRAIVEFMTGLFDDALVPALNWIITRLEDVVNAAVRAVGFVRHLLDESKREDFISRHSVQFGGVQAGGGGAGADIARPEALNVSRMVDALRNAGSATLTAAQQIWNNAKNLAETIGEPFADISSEFVTELTAILNRDLPEGMRMSAAELTLALERGSTEIRGAVFDGVAGAFSELDAGPTGQATGAAGVPMGANPVEFLSAMAGPLGIVIQAFAEMLLQIEAVSALMAPFKVILDGILSVLGPVMNEGLAPLVGILRVIGQVVGSLLVPIFQMWLPIIQLVSEAFVWLYNKAIMPIANMFIHVGNVIYNAIASMVNWVIGVLNKLPGVNISKVALRSQDQGKLSEIDMSDLTSAGREGMGTGDAGRNAQYTTGRNITVNIEINTDVIAGPGGIRGLSLMIRDEIRSAEALGA